MLVKKVMGTSCLIRTVFRALMIVKKQLYTTLIRSILEYCVSAWTGLYKINTARIEKVQRAAARFILDYGGRSNKEMLKLNLLPLSPTEGILIVYFFL